MEQPEGGTQGLYSVLEGGTDDPLSPKKASIDEDIFHSEDEVEVEELSEKELSESAEAFPQSIESSQPLMPSSQKQDVHEDLSHLHVATVTTKMRAFWVNLINDEREKPKPPSPRVAPRKLNLNASIDRADYHTAPVTQQSPPANVGSPASKRLTTKITSTLRPFRKGSDSKSPNGSFLGSPPEKASAPSDKELMLDLKVAVGKVKTRLGSAERSSSFGGSEDQPVKVPEQKSKDLESVKSKSFEDEQNLRKANEEKSRDGKSKDDKSKDQRMKWQDKTDTKSKSGSMLLTVSQEVDLKPEGKRSSRKSLFMKRTNSRLYTFKEKELKRMQWGDIRSNTTIVNTLIEENDKAYMMELGNSLVTADNQSLELEDTEKYEKYYKDYFYGKEHVNYFGSLGRGQWALISISQVEETADGKIFFRSLIRMPTGDKRIDIVRQDHAQQKGSKISQKTLLKELQAALSHLLFKTALARIDGAKLQDDLLQFESRQSIAGIKLGVLLVKEGQSSEEEMFSNKDPTPLFQEFLDFLGDEIKLKDWRGYRGGLDVNTNTTGERSVSTKFRNLEIMYHVSTHLPMSTFDSQQLERKRHIGNDIVVIVFNESEKPFSVQTVRSEFNHIWAVFQPIVEKGLPTKYKVAFAAKPGVPPFGPLLPSPAIFEKNQQSRDFLLAKILNSERAACASPQFLTKIVRTRKQLLEDLAKSYLPLKQFKKIDEVS